MLKRQADIWLIILNRSIIFRGGRYSLSLVDSIYLIKCSTISDRIGFVVHNYCFFSLLYNLDLNFWALYFLFSGKQCSKQFERKIKLSEILWNLMKQRYFLAKNVNSFFFVRLFFAPTVLSEPLILQLIVC